MALDRNIFWIGRQWAVTGAGIQAIDQRLQGAFDIELAKLWEDDIDDRMRAYPSLNVDDFSKALELARARFPKHPAKSLPLVESVLELMKPEPEPEAAASALAWDILSAPPEPVHAASMDEPPRAASSLMLRIEQAAAKFLPQWRIRR